MAESYRLGGVAGTVSAFNFIRRISFPTTPQVVSIFCTIVFLSAIIAMPLSGLGLLPTFIIPSSVIILPSLVGELLNAEIFLRADSILSFRRLMGVELLCWAPLLILLPLGSAAGLWAYGFLMALVISLPVRFLAMVSMTNVAAWRSFTAAAIVPSLSLLAYLSGLLFHETLTSSALLQASIAILACVAFSAVGVTRIVRGVDLAGVPRIGDAPMALFRDFLRHWLEAESGPLESRLAAIGSQAEAGMSILAFEGAHVPTRGCFALSEFHPGPYRNLGSGGLPSQLKAAIESYRHAAALVPHGVSNHEHNIITQADIAKFLEETRKAYPSKFEIKTASTMVRERVGDGQASAQCFGKAIVVTLTLAPKSMEDLPFEVGRSIEAKALDKGAKTLLIDAHNSLRGPTKISREEGAVLAEAAGKALDTSLSLQQETFKIGVASDPLEEFSLDDGIGPGGLSVIVVQTGGQLVAYVTVDGNNMQTGFREKVLSELRGIGIDDGEIMTTDTHLVTGLVRSPLGYYPIGEHIPQELFLEKILDTTKRAVEGMEPASAGYSSFRLNLRVLGSETFQSITSFVGSVARRIGRAFLSLEIVVSLAGLTILALL